MFHLLVSLAAMDDSPVLAGMVIDGGGLPVPGVTVAAEAAWDGQVAETVSAANGEFYFSDLPLGAYTVTASMPGFASHETTNWELTETTGPLVIELRLTDAGIELTQPEVVDSESFLSVPGRGRAYEANITPCIPYRVREGDTPEHVVYDCSVAFTEGVIWPETLATSLPAAVVMTPGMVPTTAGLRLHGFQPALVVDGHRL